MGSFYSRAAGAVGAVLAGVGLAAVPSAAQAQTISVACGDTPGLIAAITTANAATSAKIRLGRNCTYDLTAAFAQVTPPATRGPNGLPIITGDISIDGRGSTIRRTVAAQFRILEVAAGAVLRATGLGISGGDAGAETGGGVLNARGRVLFDKSTISGNTADNGAGLSNDSGDMRLERSTVSNNQTRANGGGGGGIYSDGFLMVERSRLTANQANTNGGGLFSELGGRVVLNRSDITSNRAVLGTGGGLHNADGGIVQGSRLKLEFNTATDGGAAFNGARAGSVTFSKSNFRSNSPNNCVPLNTLRGCRN
ncbi:MAG: hypothetical protein ACRDOO_01335 [Actinomadura sp.]